MERYLALLFLNFLLILSCSQAPLEVQYNSKGVLSLNLVLKHANILKKTQAISQGDSLILLKRLIIQFNSNSGENFKDTINVNSNSRNFQILPIKNYELTALKTWKAKYFVYDLIDSLIFYDSSEFKILPGDTTFEFKQLESRFAIFVARFVSTSNRIVPIKKLVLRINGKQVNSYVFPQKKKVFDVYLNFRYLETKKTNFIELLAYKNNSVIQYSSSFNFNIDSGEDITITMPLN